MYMRKFKILLIILSIILITGCKKNDSILFKEEYESLNSNNKYRSVFIDKNNPMVYITDKELLEKIKNKEDMVVYFGFNKCPWCRSVIETLIAVSKDLEIKEIYYLDILNIRDIKEIDTGGNIKTTKEGSLAYLEIVDLLSEYLDDYVIEDEVVGKRIYAPNILVIKNKEVLGIETGISEKLTSPNGELTEEIKKDTYDKLYALLEKYNNNSCSPEHGC